MTGVPAGAWALRVSPMPPGAYLKSARLGDTEVLRNGLTTARAAGSELELVVSGKGAGIDGAITGAEGGSPYFVKLAAEEKSPLRWTDEGALCEPNGRFRLSGLRPGTCRMLAVPQHDVERISHPELVKDWKPDDDREGAGGRTDDPRL